MRRIMMFNRVSADGYFSTPSGGLDWTIQEPDLDKDMGGNLGDNGTILFGRKTYDSFESFWPNALKEGEASKKVKAPHGEKRESEALYQMAKWINDATKIVFSKSRKDVSWHNSKLIREFDPKAIEDMKQQSGKDMIVFGSGSIVSLLTQHGLIDDYLFVVCPLILGSGKSIFTGPEKHLKLELVESKSYPRGNVTMRYRKA
jgi:dihydrofolate reductase